MQVGGYLRRVSLSPYLSACFSTERENEELSNQSRKGARGEGAVFKSSRYALSKVLSYAGQENGGGGTFGKAHFSAGKSSFSALSLRELKGGKRKRSRADCFNTV